MLPMQTLSRHEGSVNCVVIHKDLLLSGSEDMEIKVSILLNNRITILLIRFGYFERSIALSPEIPIPNRGRVCLASAEGAGRLQCFGTSSFLSVRSFCLFTLLPCFCFLLLARL